MTKSLEITLTRNRKVPKEAVSVSFIRSSGPGGQNVNKVATKVQMSVDISYLEAILSMREFAQLKIKLKTRIDQRGNFCLTCDETRTQKRNLETAFKRCEFLIKDAIKLPKRRKKTKPSRSSIERRLQEKKKQSAKKEARKNIVD